MNIHEYQAKILLAKFGIPVPPFEVVASVQEVAPALAKLGISEGVIKAQIHAGGRGKAGGVKFGRSREELIGLAKEMLGMRIQNGQTGPLGVVVDKLLIAPKAIIKKEYYIAAIIDREKAEPIIMASPEGGMEIEELAASRPDRIIKIPVERSGEIKEEHLARLLQFMGWTDLLQKQGAALVGNLAKAFLQCDGSLLEINPLALTDKGELSALDAKFAIDDNALYRQPEIAKWYDPSQYTKGEVMAKEQGLSYIGLDGEVGCLVNGAGLAMATMDIIYHYGGAPANFLDVGGGATKEQVSWGFKIILSDPNVKSIFVNIFGGIMDCAVLAEGLVAAAKEGVSVPLVVRMEGTNVEKGREILERSGLRIIMATGMADGAKKAVKWRS